MRMSPSVHSSPSSKPLMLMLPLISMLAHIRCYGLTEFEMCRFSLFRPRLPWAQKPFTRVQLFPQNFFSMPHGGWSI